MANIDDPAEAVENRRRGANGRFAKGNPGGPGNPHAKRTAAIRGLLLDAVTDDDLRAVIAKLVEMAKVGDLAAIRELFDRMLGKPVVGVLVAGAEVDQPEPIRLTDAEKRALIEKIVTEAGYVDDEDGDDGEETTPVRLAARLMVVGAGDGVP